ncbi:MAG: QacE family quaternary ammonium compound efflux SMR transporter [SAR116 cluster bacterium]|nr:QacE family quaternary ammonium compound efflux SMR transporter [SAR116 cluster bacterium]RPG92717.1 MAG: multidrug efflux SMR transporter [Candidatus Puniceispirillum sp. TMED213]
MSLNYVYLFFAILLEVTGTMLLPASQNFTKAVPTVSLGICYMASFYLLTFVIRTIPVPIVYATWSGLGIFTIAIASVVIFKQTLSLPVIFGLFLIIIGVVLVNFYGPLHS